MNKNLSCETIVFNAVRVAEEELSPLFVEDHKKTGILRSYCKALDEITDEFQAVSFSARADTEAMTVVVCFECMEFTVRDISHPFFQLAERSTKLRFYQADKSLVGVEFTFPSIWVSTVL